MNPNKTLGGFILGEKIGAGAMGTVYRAHQRSLGRDVVIKTLHPHLAEDDKLIARFQREARHAAKLQHPNTVQIIDFGVDGGAHYIVMELIDGVDLKDLLRSVGPPPLSIAPLFVLHLMRGLEAAHDNEVIHRDIKPANLMLTAGGSVKVMDFGLARQAEGSTITVTGAVMGSAAYMSPEQAQGQTLDHRSDVYSAGLVAYELLCGERAFPGESYAVVLHNVIYEDPVPLRERNPEVPEPLAEIIQWMLHKDLAERCPTSGAAREKLEVVLDREVLARTEAILREYYVSIGDRLPARAAFAPLTDDESGTALDSGSGEQMQTLVPPRQEATQLQEATRRVEPGAGGSRGGGANGAGADGSGDGAPTGRHAPDARIGGDDLPRTSLKRQLILAGGTVAVLALLLWITLGGRWQSDSSPVPVAPPDSVATDFRAEDLRDDGASSGVRDDASRDERGGRNDGATEPGQQGRTDDVTPTGDRDGGSPENTSRSDAADASEAGNDGPSSSGATTGDAAVFRQTYSISTRPWAYVYVDNDPRRRNEDGGGFTTTLVEGLHLFRIVNEGAGVDITMQYEVAPGDPNRRLVFDYLNEEVKASP